jgi:hypothetical protein
MAGRGRSGPLSSARDWKGDRSAVAFFCLLAVDLSLTAKVAAQSWAKGQAFPTPLPRLCEAGAARRQFGLPPSTSLGADSSLAALAKDGVPGLSGAPRQNQHIHRPATLRLPSSGGT